MRTLFNLQSPVQTGVLRSPTWNYVREGLRENLATILRFHRRNPTAVKSSHFLVRLLGAIAIPHSLNIERYVENVESLALDTSMALKMTSSIYKGAVFRGIFYGPECHEILMADDSPFDFYAADKNWQNLAPVTVLRHPRSDLTMNLPDGSHTSAEFGLAVVKIHITMLAVMYRAFVRNEMQTKGTSEPHLTPTQFLRMYVIPNMLFSHLDVAIFNRLDNLAKGAPLGRSLKKHSFALIDYSKRVDDEHRKQLEYLEKKKMSFVTIMKNIPAVVKEDMAEVMRLPDLAPTRQITWAFVMARLPILSFLFRAGRDRPNTMNQHDINQIRRAIHSYHSDDVLASTLPAEDYFDAQLELSTIMDQSLM
jgi:hypothetical protein